MVKLSNLHTIYLTKGISIIIDKIIRIKELTPNLTITLAILYLSSFTSCQSNDTLQEITPKEFAILCADVYDKNYIETLPKDWEILLDMESTSWYQNINLDLITEGVTAIESAVNGDSTWQKKAAKVILQTLSAGGYFARAYRHTKSNQIVVAHRGTDFPSALEQNPATMREVAWGLLVFAQDLDDDLNIFWGEIPDKQFEKAKNFVKSVKDTFQARYQSQPNIIHVGHSLGGILAQLCALKDSSSAITFESPGCLEPAQSLFNQSLIEANAKKITNYKAAPNAINSCNHQCGQVIRLYPPLRATSSNTTNIGLLGTDTLTAILEYLQFTLDQHSMTGLLNTFDDSGYPAIYSNQTKTWPLADKKSLGLNYYMKQVNHPQLYATGGVNQPVPHIEQKGVHIIGNHENNSISGATGYNDSLSAGDGNDRLWGYGGHDVLLGGLGNDTLEAGQGNDHLIGGEGQDVYLLNSTERGINMIHDNDGQLFINNILFEATLNSKTSKQEILHEGVNLEILLDKDTLIIKNENFEVHILNFKIGFWSVK